MSPLSANFHFPLAALTTQTLAHHQGGGPEQEGVGPGFDVWFLQSSDSSEVWSRGAHDTTGHVSNSLRLQLCQGRLGKEGGGLGSRWHSRTSPPGAPGPPTGGQEMVGGGREASQGPRTQG